MKIFQQMLTDKALVCECARDGLGRHVSFIYK